MASRPVKPTAVYKTDKTGCGLLSIAVTAACLLIIIAVAVFAYFSPLFDSFRSQETAPTAVEAPVEPIKDPNAPIEYEFYEVLPEQEFRSTPEGLGASTQSTEPSAVTPDTTVTAKPGVEPKADTPADADSTDKSNKADKATKADDSVSITEESAVYDEPANNGTSSNTADTKADTTYILQIRSYTTADEADVKRAEVLMAGVDAVVVKRTDSAKGTHFYQVVSTPMKNREEASQASTRLRNNGIDSLIVEQKR
ncbi:SPOR domain-containing protein [uncultured Moraxella sp.]|uniref:SPOR domain-containing protein n=1 Tax=uncultured Moraxella sp. TaxID=263769 RepID=UPI0025FE66C4|nr:SPOR domain-containing protein [uncultured Moraxella sp.]